MKNKLLLLFSIMLIALLVGCGSQNPSEEPSKGGQSEDKQADQSFYSVVSSEPGGTWYTMIGGAISIYNKEIPNASFNIEASGGSVENIRRVASGECDFGMAHASHLYEIYNGEGTFEGQQNKDAQVLCQVVSSPHYFVTLKDKGIKSMKDLEGKKVAIGAPGSGTSYNSRQFLNALGIKVEEVELSFSDASRALQEGKIDALGQGGAPAAGVVELAASKDMLIIPASEDELKTLMEQMPFYEVGELPANTYEGQIEAVPTFFFNVFMIANKNVAPEMVENVLKATFDNQDALVSVHPQWKGLKNNPEAIKLIGVDYHTGAESYWK